MEKGIIRQRQLSELFTLPTTSDPTKKRETSNALAKKTGQNCLNKSGEKIEMAVLNSDVPVPAKHQELLSKRPELRKIPRLLDKYIKSEHEREAYMDDDNEPTRGEHITVVTSGTLVAEVPGLDEGQAMLQTIRATHKFFNREDVYDICYTSIRRVQGTHANEVYDVPCQVRALFTAPINEMPFHFALVEELYPRPGLQNDDLTSFGCHAYKKKEPGDDARDARYKVVALSKLRKVVAIVPHVLKNTQGKEEIVYRLNPFQFHNLEKSVERPSEAMEDGDLVGTSQPRNKRQRTGS